MIAAVEFTFLEDSVLVRVYNADTVLDQRVWL